MKDIKEEERKKENRTAIQKTNQPDHMDHSFV